MSYLIPHQNTSTTRYLRNPKEKLDKVGLRQVSSSCCNETNSHRIWLFRLRGCGHAELQTRTLASMRTQPGLSPRRSDCMKRQIKGLAPVIMCVSPVDYALFLKKKKKNCLLAT